MEEMQKLFCEDAQQENWEDEYFDDLEHATDDQGRPLSEPMTRGELIELFNQRELDLFIHLALVIFALILFR